MCLLSSPGRQLLRGTAHTVSRFTTAHAMSRFSSTVSAESLARFSAAFNTEPRNTLAQNAITRSKLYDVLVSRTATLPVVHQFNHRIEAESKATNQKSSGRCWIFAALNMLRLNLIKKHNLENDFELSQPHLFFYDKLEKANWFLESMMSEELLAAPAGDRTLDFLLKDPVQDGGQWDMIVALVRKYGIVPKTVYPESYQTSNSAQVRWLITCRLREAASHFRKLFASGASREDLAEEKERRLEEIYRVLAIAYGEPPHTFDWCFRDKSKKYQQFCNLTPLDFYRTHVKEDLDRYFSLVHDPRNPYMRAYTVEFLGNVRGQAVNEITMDNAQEHTSNSIDSEPSVVAAETATPELKAEAAQPITISMPPLGKHQQVRYINVPIERMRDLTAAVLCSGKPVWFGCEVGKHFARPTGVLDIGSMDYKSSFGVEFEMSKAERLQYGESAMTHAMMFTGVHMHPETNEPVRFRVENSWGEDGDTKGYLSMSARWFDEYNFQVVLCIDDIPEDVREVLTQQAIVLPPWDPMGSLA